MANKTILTGLGAEAAIKQCDEGERLHVLLEVRTGSDLMHVKVVADDPRILNCFRQYRSPKLLFVCGELRADSEGGLYVLARELDYARASSRKPKLFNPVLKPLPAETFVSR